VAGRSSLAHNQSSPSQPTQKRESDSGGSRVPPSEPRYLAIGKVSRAHGVRGELSVTVLTEFPERFETTEWVFLGNEYEAVPYHLEGYRWHKKNILLSLSGIDTRTLAEQFIGDYVQVPLEDAVPLPEGSYYLYELVGLDVVTTTGEPLGAVVDIIETGANDVYVVDNGDRTVLLPAIPDVVQAIDIEQGRMVVELIDGLI
jgi:16S rRNA processing protein RimM